MSTSAALPPWRVEAGDGSIRGEQEGYQQETAKLRQEKVNREMTSEVPERAGMSRQELGCGS